MAMWKVKTTVKLHSELEFEHDIEADNEAEAISNAEDSIDEDLIMYKLKAEGDIAGEASYSGIATTDAVPCKTCENLFAADELNGDGECDECVAEEEEEEEDDDEEE